MSSKSRGRSPVDRRVELFLGRGVLVARRHVRDYPCDGLEGRTSMILDNWLAQRAETSPDRTALLAGEAELSYAELEAEATKAARRLAAQGVRAEASVALTRPAGAEYVVLLHALMKLGAVAYPLNPGLAPVELTDQLDRAKTCPRPRPGRPPDDDRGRSAAPGRAPPRRGSLPDPDQRDLRGGARGRASPTATTSGARSARRSTSVSTPVIAGFAVSRSITSRASRSSFAP